MLKVPRSNEVLPDAGGAPILVAVQGLGTPCADEGRGARTKSISGNTRRVRLSIRFRMLPPEEFAILRVRLAKRLPRLGRSVGVASGAGLQKTSKNVEL